MDTSGVPLHACNRSAHADPRLNNVWIPLIKAHACAAQHSNWSHQTSASAVHPDSVAALARQSIAAELVWLTLSLQCRFRLINQRQDMVFKLFRNISRAGNFSAEDVVATSPVISFASYNEPTQGHLAMTADPRQGSVISICTLCVPAYQRCGLSSLNRPFYMPGWHSDTCRGDLCLLQPGWGWLSRVWLLTPQRAETIQTKNPLQASPQ